MMFLVGQDLFFKIHCDSTTLFMKTEVEFLNLSINMKRFQGEVGMGRYRYKHDPCAITICYTSKIYINVITYWLKHSTLSLQNTNYVTQNSHKIRKIKSHGLVQNTKTKLYCYVTAKKWHARKALRQNMFKVIISVKENEHVYFTCLQHNLHFVVYCVFHLWSINDPEIKTIC